MSASLSVPTVAILLATRDGAPYLDAQLRSIEEQTHASIDIWASDDGSTDATQAILSEWRGRWRKGGFRIVAGPRRGFAENFRSLIAEAAVEADYFAFCDQDDLWEPQKLTTAIEWMRAAGDATPRLFCSRTLTIAETGEAVGMSPLFRRPPSFRNALVQSIAGGNTMVLNRAAMRPLRLASRRSGFVSHDWWAYQVVTGIGGSVRYAPEPLVRYRQHAANLVGANTSWTARFERMKFTLDGRFARWNDVNLAALRLNRDLLAPEAVAVLDLFSRARQRRMPGALLDLWRSGVYRQTAQGTLALWLALACGLI